MPHLKVKPFDLSLMDEKLEKNPLVTFVAKAFNCEERLLGISYSGEAFLLQLKKDPKGYLLKYDKVTRPLKVQLLKEALQHVVEALELEVLSSNIAISNTKAPLSSEYFKKIEAFESIMYPKEKVSVEVGFGSGRHLLHQAKKNPDTLFIGLEIHTPSAQQVLKQIELQSIENIWVVNYDARLFLEMLPSNICEKIYVHFPVPWDKKPHRRVISPSFLEESLRVLYPGGQLELRTDSDNYFWYALETFFAIPKAEVTVRKNEALEVTSKYEARWLKQEKDIYDVYVKSMQLSPAKNEPAQFNFHGVKYKSEIENRLPKEALVFENYFVHFERIYKIDPQGLLIKAAFGSFDRPEHKYILLGEEGCSYFASEPVKTSVNHLAHQTTVEQLMQMQGA
ncbi:MAG: hypothetical protein RL113_200 [Pseudomonadota bacterium]